MIKAVICDLDETLLPEDKKVSKQDLDTIEKLKEKGIYFIPATGRPFYSIYSNLEAMNLFADNDFSISYNGGMIHSNKDKKIVHAASLDHHLASWLFNFGHQEKVTMHVYIENETYFYHLNEEERHHCRNFPGFYERFDEDLNFLNKIPIIKILFQNLDLDYLASLEAQIPQEIKDKLEISYSSNRYLEFNPKGVSKGQAVKYLAKKLNIDPDSILSIGDNINDLSMLKVTGYSGAPQNAVAMVKEAVDYVSEKTYNEATVSDIIKHFIKEVI